MLKKKVLKKTRNSTLPDGSWLNLSSEFRAGCEPLESTSSGSFNKKPSDETSPRLERTTHPSLLFCDEEETLVDTLSRRSL